MTDLLTIAQQELPPDPDFWVVMFYDGDCGGHYLEVSEDARSRDVLINGNPEDDGIMFPEDLKPGVYRFKLSVSGGQDRFDPFDFWTEISATVDKALWVYDPATENTAHSFGSCIKVHDITDPAVRISVSKCSVCLEQENAQLRAVLSDARYIMNRSANRLELVAPYCAEAPFLRRVVANVDVALKGGGDAD